MKGIILAGGSGTRLHPLTLAVSKQLLPVYDKPMIYYPLSTLMQAGIREIAIISTPTDVPVFQKLLWDGSTIGCTFEYLVQPSPDWLAQAFIIAEKFIGKDTVWLVLWDNIFFSWNGEWLFEVPETLRGWCIFAYRVSDPERYGVVEFNDAGEVISIEEKPTNPKSNYAVPWLYFYDNSVIEKAKKLLPSIRWELEITDINNLYIAEWTLLVQKLPRWTAWFDTGTFSSLAQAGSFVEAYQERTGLKIGAIEEIAYNKWYIVREQLIEIGKKYRKSGYGKSLMQVGRGGV
jgi:glucose-1-phosphate thymidylyltransferase